MKRSALYSRSGPARGRPRRAPAEDSRPRTGDDAPPPANALTPPQPAAIPARKPRFERLALIGIGALLAGLVLVSHAWLTQTPENLSARDLDAAIQRKLDEQALISPAVHAHRIIGPSVVRVRGLGADSPDSPDGEHSVGTGVVIIDDGTILTNLHVVATAERIRLVFADGFQSDARIVGTRPEHDLAVLQADEIPPNIVPATMRSTAGLALGERVVAVGFPFGLGPSVSAGVVSGLRREFVSPEGQRRLTNLIQFDAAANPGSSGGPLVTSDGEVVGIVTGILNPRKHGVFVGISFAVPIENAAGAAGVSPF